MGNAQITHNPELDKYKDIILFPTKHQSAVETLLTVPLPNQALLSPIEKINVLLAEIEKINLSIKYFEVKNDAKKIQECESMKENFALFIQKIMQEQFQDFIYQKAA